MAKYEIATPERFSVQARNDREDKVASLLAMTIHRIGNQKESQMNYI
jgi:hypothetical protein